jgi:LysM repeat protein
MATQPLRVPQPGPERYVLVLALCVPLVLMGYAVLQLPLGLGFGASRAAPRDEAQLVAQRPAASKPAPPPTLVAPTATPVPTPTAVPTPAPEAPRSYTVKRGDELKNIAAEYQVSIWSIIDNNDIPNPDSLTVGQVLQIPSH